MSDHVSPTIIFRDVAVYFSEKEWQLLEVWQRDLYTGVIKEIHGILISLGFIILNPNNFLRIQPEDEPCRRSRHGFEKNKSINIANSDCGLVNPDILLTVQLGEKQHVADSYKQDGGKNISFPSTSKFIDKFGEYTAIKQEAHLGDYSVPPEIEILENSTKYYPCSDPAVLRVKLEEHSSNSANLNLEGKRGIKYGAVQGHRASTSGLRKTNAIAVPENLNMKKPYHACDKNFTMKGYPVIEPVTLKAKSKEQPSNTENLGLEGRNIINYSIEDALTNRIKWYLPPDDYDNKHNLPERSLEKNRENVLQIFSQKNAYNKLHLPKSCIPENRLNASTSGVNSSDTITNPVKLKILRPYKCSECERAFSVKTYLIKHKRIHTGERPYKCSVCGKDFTQKSTLNVHFRTHTGERPYPCSICGKCFIDNSGLIQHKRIHTGERPFQCLHCQKRFCKKEHLKVHARTHTGEKPYICTDCGKSFCHKVDLTKHMTTHARNSTDDILPFMEEDGKVDTLCPSISLIGQDP
ncbi:hypothetical protein FKM82_013521 [Ascaphus truei]